MPVPKALFVPNPRGIEEAMSMPRITARLEARANAIAARARTRAKQVAYDTGDYHDSIHVTRDTRSKRPRFRVVASDYKATWIEFGTDIMRARRVLGRAAYTKAVR